MFFQRLSPPNVHSDSDGDDGGIAASQSSFRQAQPRRKRVEYSEQEERDLTDGVTKRGKFWTEILCSYDFHPSRTAVDLKDKYKRMQASLCRFS